MNNSNFPAWHNGKFCLVKDLNINIQDFGLLRSDGVYEVIAIRDSRMLVIDKHIERFINGCKHYYININYNSQQLINVIQELYHRVDINDVQIWLVATRGIPDSYAFNDVVNSKSQIMLMTSKYHMVNNGLPLSLTIARTVRRIPDWAIDQRYKNFARQDFTKATSEAVMRKFNFALLLDENNYITEGSQFSVAIIKNNNVYAPARNKLAGITMTVIEQLCKENNINFYYSDIDEERLNQADDMFATTTAGGIISISCVDNKIFTASELQNRLKTLYQNSWKQDQYSMELHKQL